VLTRVDRASMATSLEMRAPLLDTELATFVHSLPFDLKMRGLTRKRVFKQALHGRVPTEVLRARKRGFDAPIVHWLRGPLRDQAEDLLSRERLLKHGILDPDRVLPLVRAHGQGRRDHRKEIWSLYILQSRLDRRGRTASSVAA
jgi:asparagine synthase (glutamine-hydrolysing)